MYLNRLLVLGSVALSICAAQDHTPKPKVSKDPLTTEQIAVYRAVLENYLKDSPGSLNLAVITEPLEQSAPFFDKACVRELELESAASAIPVIHMLTAVVAPSSAKIVLVDPARQQKRVNENDPQKVVNKAIEGHEKVTKKKLDASVERAFSTGLFTLSEVVFDKQPSCCSGIQLCLRRSLWAWFDTDPHESWSKLEGQQTLRRLDFLNGYLQQAREVCAYFHWIERGRPLWEADIDWALAEQEFLSW